MPDYLNEYSGSHLLAIGINSYSDPQLQSLDNAEDDTKKVATLLSTSPYNFTVQLLLGSQATRAIILDAIYELESANINDRVLFYFAGHGYTLTDNFGNETGYLTCYDTIPQRHHTALRMNEVTDLRLRAKAKHIAFIFDACFSGQALGMVKLRSATDKFLERRAYQVLSAGAGDQAVADTRSMTRYLLNVLSPQNVSTEPLRLNPIGLTLQEQMAASTNHTQIPQFGHLEGSQGGDFVFYIPPKGKPIDLLPERLRRGVLSPDANTRYLAVEALEKLLADPKTGEAVRSVLDDLVTNDDNREVRQRARTAIQPAQAEKASALASKGVVAAVSTPKASPVSQPEQTSTSISQSSDQALTDSTNSEPALPLRMKEGDSFGSYQLLETISYGSTYVIYKATQLSIGRIIALQVLPVYFLQDPSFLPRFEAAANNLARLQHPQIAPVYDYGVIDQRPFIVMSYLPNGSLADRVAQGKMDLEKIANIIEQTASALDYAHRHNITHGDLSPTHILFGTQHSIYVAGFGLTWAIAPTQKLMNDRAVGTLAYFAPELMTQEAKPSPASDLYSLGVIAYQMVTGHLPFQADTPELLTIAHANEPNPDARAFRPDVSADLVDILQKAMAKNPAGRYKSAGEIALALKAAVAI